MNEQDSSEFLYHLPCGKCGSSDANSMYSDGHQHCFACGSTVQGEGSTSPQKGGRSTVPASLITDGEIVGLGSRRIRQETCKKLGYRVGRFKGQPVQIAPYFNKDRQLVAQKLRFKNKDFRVLGDIKEALPFGSQAWPIGGRKLVLTEGEIDALAVAQAFDLKYPVWSISCGADKPADDFGNPLPMTKIKKYIAKHGEHFKAFDEVVLLFDQDEPGQRSAEVAAKVIGHHARIAKLPLKDAGEMVAEGRTKELIDAIYRAQPYRPDGIVDLASLRDRIKERPKLGLSWCFPELTRLTYGKRVGELVALGAGTGVGKTDFMTQDMLHMVEEHGEKIGVFALEQEVTETGLRLVGKAASRPLHIPDYWDPEVFDATWDRLVKDGMIFLFDHFGAMDWETVESHIEFLHHSEGVCWFYFDHLTAAAAAEEDERKGLERIMSRMGGLVKRLPIHITFVSHLSTPDGKPHEEGGRVMIRHFKGSRSIGFWSHFMFGLERDQQAEDEEERTTTTFRILKDRYTGRSTGKTFHLGYDPEKGLLYEKEDFGFNDESDADCQEGEESDF